MDSGVNYLPTQIVLVMQYLLCNIGQTDLGYRSRLSCFLDGSHTLDIRCLVIQSCLALWATLTVWGTSLIHTVFIHTLSSR